METENKILMTVETGNSVKTIADLKKEISDLKKALDQEAVGSEEAKKASEDLANAQNQLQQAVKGSTDVINIADGSYKSLEQQCNKLKLAYKSMADGIEKRKIGKKIADIQENLKKQDAAIGDFKRNVGDYANAFGAALTSMGAKGGAAFTNLANAGKGFKVVLDLLKAHPIILTISVITLALMGLVKLIKSNEEAVRKLMISLEPFKKLFDVILKAAQKLAGFVADGLVKAFDALAVVVERVMEQLGREDVAQKMKEARDLAKEQAYYQKEIEKSAKNRNKYTLEMIDAQMRYLKATGDENKQTEIAIEIEKTRYKAALAAYKQAKQEYELKKLTAKESEEASKEAEEALQRMYAAQQNLFDKSNEWLENIKKIGEEERKNVLKKMEAEIQANLDRSEAAIRRFYAQFKLLKEELDRVNISLTNLSLSPADREALENRKRGLEDDLEALKSYIKAEKDLYDTNRALLKSYEDEINGVSANTAKTIDELVKKIEKKSKKLFFEDFLSYFNFGTKKLKDLTKEQLEEILDSWDEVIEKDKQRYKDKLISDIESRGKSFVDYVLAFFKYDKKKLTDLTIEQLKEIEENWDKITQEGIQRVGDKLKEPKIKIPVEVELVRAREDDEETLKSLERADELRKAVEAVYKKYSETELTYREEYAKNLNYLKNAEKTHLIDHEQFLKAKANLDKEYNDNLRKTLAEEVKLYASIGDSFASILSSIADTMDENNEEAFEAAKAFNIAATVVQTVAGIATAISGAFTTKTGPWDMVLAAIQAAAIGASGIASIANISRQQYKSTNTSAISSSVGTASSSAINAINAPLQYTTAVEGAAINDNIADTKVYVVESDIQTVGRKVDVQEQENHY